MPGEQDETAIMESNPTLWEQVARWSLQVLSVVTLGFLAAVRWWVGDRFSKVDDRLDEQDQKIAEHESRHAEHHENLSVLVVHIENGSKERARIESKLDKLDGKLDKLVERC